MPDRNNNHSNPRNNSNNRRHNQGQDQDHWSESSRVPITWNQFRRSQAYNRYESVEEERRHLRSLITENTSNFLGTKQEHWIPERERRDFELSYRDTNYQAQYWRPSTTPLGAIRTTIQIYPEGFPNFEFVDPNTGSIVSTAYPSHRDPRIPRNSRIILQALEVAFRGPGLDYFEEEE